MRLAGSLWHPPGQAAGALLMLPGSGAADRHNDTLFAPIREHLLGCGFAVASFDKRGVGESTGDWRSVGVEALAEDAATALAAVRNASGVPPSRIGLFGHSQGGWVAMVAAAADPLVPFLVTNSGPWVSVAEQVRFSAEVALAQAEADPDRAASELLDRVIALAVTGAPWEDAVSLAHQYQATSLRLEGAGFDWPTRAEWPGLCQLLRFDPAPSIGELACSVLALFGAEDRLVPVARSLAVAEALAPDPSRLTTRVFSGADHRMRRGGDVFVPAYLPTLGEWLLGMVAEARSPA